MAIQFAYCNIFDSRCEHLVNTVNCRGAMGAGIAKQFATRYPEMAAQHKRYYQEGLLAPGILWIYHGHDGRRVLNFPTKDDQKLPSKIEYIRLGLEKFVDTYKNKEIKSIAFPPLGTGLGGLDKDDVKEVMLEYLSDLPIYIEIYNL